MDMHTLESIRRIKEASKNGKLVMFVGAGVSALSGYPSWTGLIEKLDLSMNKKGEYSDEEYLTIPQKYYNSRGNKEYYDIIKNTFDMELEPNYIQNKILRLNPTHIITTNYDNLIEKSVIKKGLFYDVVSRDRDVATTKSKKFIIKMHGEIKHENIVLKEEDFINYDNNFKLIETLVKSIIASNLVVFVGYSIKEINVKKILSWVKELQGDSFQPTYWLYIGSPTEESDKITKEDYDYYKARGINIIDYNDLNTENKKIESYAERYNLLLDCILKYEENTNYKSKKNINYLYNELIPLNSLSRVRVKDVRDKIGDEYHIDNTGIIYENSNDIEGGKGYIEEFNEIHEKINIKECINTQEKKTYELIKDVFKKSNIQVCKDFKNEKYIQYEFNNEVKLSDFHYFNYLNMNEFVIKSNTDINNNYKKAFYLCKLKRFEDSYDLYSEICIKTFESKNYLMYYLSQVNRYWIGKIVFMNSYMFEKDFIDKVKSDLENIEIGNLFSSLPTSFKNKFKTLEEVANFEIIHNNLFKVSKIVKKADYNRTSDTIELGLTKFDELFYIVTEILEFLTENYIILDSFNEVKTLLREYIGVMLSEYSHQRNKTLTKNSFECFFEFEDYLDEIIKVKYLDILIMTRYIDNKELKNLFKQNNVNSLEVDDINKCINILENISMYLLSNKHIDFKLSNELKNELKNIVFLLGHMNISTEEYIKIIRILETLDNESLDINEKIMFLNRQEVYNQNKDKNIASELDKWLYNEFTKDYILNKTRYGKYNMIAQYIYEKDNNYVSEIDSLVKFQIDYMDNRNLLAIIYLNLVLSKDTKEALRVKIIKTLKKQFDFNLLNRAVKYEILTDIKDFENEIYDYLKKLEKSRPTEDRVYPDVFKSTLNSVGLIIFRKELDQYRFREFTKYSDKLEFLIDPDNFDYNKFKDEWILDYNRGFHKAIAKTKAGLKVKRILEQYINNGQNDKKLLSLYFDIYCNLRQEKNKKTKIRKFIK